MTDILTVLVGSRAHGLHTEDSDYDWRGVYVNPTSEMFRVWPDNKQTSWEEGQEDNTKWEIQRFLQLASKCNPTILEVFAAPIKDEYGMGWGQKLRDLFPYIWDPKLVKDAFIGYGLNQRKKFFDNKDGRADKFATAYARTLLQARELLRNGKLIVDANQFSIEEFTALSAFKNGNYEPGQVIDFCLKRQKEVETACEECKQKAQLEILDVFLSDVRISFLNPR